MYAITIWQPWASLIAYQCKPYEFRKWPAYRRVINQRIAIHAGARPARRNEVQDLLIRLRTDGGEGTGLLVEESIDFLERISTRLASLPLSAIVCTANMASSKLAKDIFESQVSDSDRIDHHMWAWPLGAVQRLEPPQPATGKQGFWEWSGAS